MLNERRSFSVPQELRRSPDPILGLSRLYEQDSRPDKIDAGVGVFRGPDGKTYRPPAVIQAWNNLELGTPDYLSPSGEGEFLGDLRFLRGSVNLAFGRYANELLDGKKLVAAGTPGGTGAVALMIDTFRQVNPGKPVLVGMPTWPNHLQIAESQGVEIITYQHAKDNKHNFEVQLETIRRSPSDTLVLFHTGRTHNPTGVNPTTEEEWRVIAKEMGGRKAFFDTPYAGFDKGLGPDTEAIRVFLEEGVALGAGISYAKNGGLYNERPGALLIPQSTQSGALELQRLVNYLARVKYSSPPAHGERLMAEVLSSKDLFTQWNNDLREASRDLKERRSIMTKILPEFAFVSDQAGLFSILPLDIKQIGELRERHGIYMADSGRINIGGIIPKDIPRFAEGIRAVL